MIRTLLVVLLTATVIAAMAWNSVEESDVYAAPSAAQPLLGESRKLLFERFGVPSKINYGNSTMTWFYRGEKTDSPQAEFLIHESVIVGEKIPKGWKGNRVTPPKSAPYLGQPAADLARLLGSPIGMTTGSFSTQLQYPQGRIIVLKYGLVCESAQR